MRRSPGEQRAFSFYHGMYVGNFLEFAGQGDCTNFNIGQLKQGRELGRQNFFP